MTDSDSSDCNLENEHNIFVKILADYRILFGTEKSPQINKRKLAAASSLVEEYNSLCDNKLTVRQVFKKVSNMKARLKEKNYKNLTRNKKLVYTKREQMFLDVWVGNGITVLADKKAAEINSQTENQVPDNVSVKIEPDDSKFQDDHFGEGDSESGMRFQNEDDEDSKYESMSLDELKRVALIAQIKSLEEQRAAAKSKRELNSYKLWLLRQNIKKE